MGRNTKWIESEADELVEAVARRALSARLERLWHYLELSVSQPPSEPEHVHQLRVFARRTAAALEIFDAWLPKRRGRWIRKQVKRIRRAGSEARDLDVLHQRWLHEMEQKPSSQAALLVEQVKRRRRKAQWPLEDIHALLADKRFERRANKFVKRVRNRDEGPAAEPRIGEMARGALGRLVGPYLQSANIDGADAEALHAFRIQGKEVRYAMEVFAGAFDPDFRQALYLRVADLQDRLGAINDHVTAQTYLTAWCNEAQSPAVQQALEMGIGREQEAFEHSRHEFLAWWSRERREQLTAEFSRYVELALPQDSPAAAGECA